MNKIKLKNKMYQIIELEYKSIIFESDNLDKTMELFDLLKSGIPPSMLFNSFDFNNIILQKAERIDQWQKK